MVAFEPCSTLQRKEFAGEAGKAKRKDRWMRRGFLVAAMASLLAVEPLLGGCTGTMAQMPRGRANQITAVEGQCPRSGRIPISGEERSAQRDDESSVSEARMQEIIASLRRSTVLIRSDEGLGSGVVLYRCGEETAILTNRHVVEADEPRDGRVVSAPNIEVINDGLRVRPARIILAPNELDLALVFVREDIGPPVTVATGRPRIGARVVVVGNPLGVEDSVSRGIVSNYVQRESRSGFPYEAIQTDAAINPGNSGGGVFLSNGELIGIVTSKPRLGTGLAEGMGYALPMALLQDLPLEAWTEISITPYAATATVLSAR